MTEVLEVKSVPRHSENYNQWEDMAGIDLDFSSEGGLFFVTRRLAFTQTRLLQKL